MLIILIAMVIIIILIVMLIRTICQASIIITPAFYVGTVVVYDGRKVSLKNMFGKIDPFAWLFRKLN